MHSLDINVKLSAGPERRITVLSEKKKKKKKKKKRGGGGVRAQKTSVRVNAA